MPAVLRAICHTLQCMLRPQQVALQRACESEVSAHSQIAQLPSSKPKEPRAHYAVPVPPTPRLPYLPDRISVARRGSDIDPDLLPGSELVLDSVQSGNLNGHKPPAVWQFATPRHVQRAQPVSQSNSDHRKDCR